jgi:hypothetical protein
MYAMHLKLEITKRRKCESETRKRKNEIMSGFRLQKKKGEKEQTRTRVMTAPCFLIFQLNFHFL